MGDVSILNSFPFHLQSDHANWILWYLEHFDRQRTRRNESKNAMLRFQLTLSLSSRSSLRNAPIKSKLQNRTAPPPPYAHTHTRTHTHTQHTYPPRANLGHLTTFCARRMGSLTGKAFSGMGNLTLPRLVWTVVKCQVFSRAPKWRYKHVFGQDGEKRYSTELANWASFPFPFSNWTVKEILLRNSSLS